MDKAGSSGLSVSGQWLAGMRARGICRPKDFQISCVVPRAVSCGSCESMFRVLVVGLCLADNHATNGSSAKYPKHVPVSQARQASAVVLLEPTGIMPYPVFIGQLPGGGAVRSFTFCSTMGSKSFVPTISPAHLCSRQAINRTRNGACLACYEWQLREKILMRQFAPSAPHPLGVSTFAFDPQVPAQCSCKLTRRMGGQSRSQRRDGKAELLQTIHYKLHADGGVPCVVHCPHRQTSVPLGSLQFR